MRIGIDIDGVLTDIEEVQIDYGSKFFFEKGEYKGLDATKYYVSDMFKVKKSYDFEFWNSVLMDYSINGRCRNFASQVISKLRAEGYEIFIITARVADMSGYQISVEQMKENVIRWLEKSNILYDKLIFSSNDKSKDCIENNIDIMIEDNPTNILQLSKLIPVICYDANYNKECRGNNITRCYSWYDIYNTLKSRSFLQENNSKNL